MKHLYIIIALMSCNIQSMSKYKMINRPTTSQEIAASLKELGYTIKQHPVLCSLYVSVLAAATTFTWNMHPLACAGLHYFNTLPTTVFLAGVLPSEAAHRKSNHKELAFFYVEKEEFDKVTQFASKTCYEETDPATLKEQNTEFLFEALDKYNECCYWDTQEQKAAKLAQAAAIFLNHHADKARIMHILNHDLNMPHAKKWLTLTAPEPK